MIITKQTISSLAFALLIVLAGCSGFAEGGGPAEGTPTATPTPELTSEPTPEATATPTNKSTPGARTTTSEPVTTESSETETASNPKEELSKAEKFDYFDGHFEYTNERGGDADPDIIETKTFAKNDSYHITLEMRNTSNFTKSRNDRLHPLFVYLAIVEGYNKNSGEYADQDHTYIPDTVNVTFVTENGGVYQTSYMKYTWAWKHSTGDWSFTVLLGMYASSIEDGPAHTDNES